MLFLQGDRDEFAELKLLQPLIERLGPRATLKLFADADIRVQLLDAIAHWVETI